MKKMNLVLAAILTTNSVAASASAFDFATDGKNSVNFGFLHIGVHSKSDDFTSNGPAFLTPQPAGLTVGNANTLKFGYTRHLSDKWNLEFVAGLPPKHKVYGRGTLAPYGVIAEVKQMAPTVFLNYNFGDASDSFRPFVGVGLNYTKFIDRETTPISRIATGGPTSIKLTDSFGIAAQIGVNYKLTDRWVVTASVAVADVQSDLTSTTGSIERKTSIDFRPVVAGVGLGYRF